MVATEYGFTLGTSSEMERRFGGDRATALLRGYEQSWRDIDGQWRDRFMGGAELISDTGLAGISPWGSPAPGLGADFDTDSHRGITGTPDESFCLGGMEHGSAKSGDREPGSRPVARMPRLCFAGESLDRKPGNRMRVFRERLCLRLGIR